MKKKIKREIPVIVIPKGYEVEDFLDFDDSDFNEEPILAEEVKIEFERNG